MAISIDTAKSEIQTFFQDIRTTAQNQIASQSLPLIGSAPAAAAGQVLFEVLENQVLQALDGLGAGASLAEIAAALDAIDGINATASGSGIDITITKSASIDLVSTAFDLGGAVAGVGLDFDGQFASKLGADLKVALRLDDATSQLQVLNAPTSEPELKVGLDGSLTLDAEGKLGFLTISATDKDPAKPEVEVDIALDLPTGDAGSLGGATAQVTGRAGLELDIDTKFGTDIPAGILPSITTDLIVDYTTLGAVPSIAFNDITVDVRSLYSIIGQVLEPIARILDTEPLGTVLDLATGPIPIIDDLAPFLDIVPSLTHGDGVVSLADIAVLQDQLQGGGASKFFEIVSLLDLIRDLGLPPDGQDMNAIVLGDITLTGGGGGQTPNALFTGLTGDDALGFLDGFLKDSGFLDSLGAASEHFSSTAGLEIPLLEHPELIVDLLFNAIHPTVTLVKYDLPELDVHGGLSINIPVFPPIALRLFGQAAAKLDLTIGYDTAAFENGTFTFEQGFFFDATKPVGSLTAEIGAGGGIDVVALSAFATGSIGFNIDAFFDNKDGDGKLRLSELDGCFLDPITGKATANVDVEISVGFGPFSYTQKIPIASVTLADFNIFECPPPRQQPPSPPGQGLATLGALGVPTDLVLNVGDRANQRVIIADEGPQVIPGEEEGYRIDLAREPSANPGPFPSTEVPGAIIPNAFDVTAFGFTQRYGSAAEPITAIRASFGSRNDSLVIGQAITLDAHISGGGGNDFMSGGNERDFFSGDDGNDYLIGNNGADVLKGGANDDTLDGGEGADTLDGGTGRDKVTYENANKATGEGVTIYVFNGELIATGGDAFGDSLKSIEYLVGTSFNDTLYANPLIDDLSEPALRNTLEGRDGNDILYGAEGKDDFLLGGRGGDTMDGKSGTDGTSYVTSTAGVQIDMGRRIYTGGDATGDTLISIEWVQGSVFNDLIYGDSGNNTIDGLFGDDWLTGGGGTDKVFGDIGNDTIFGFVDGDTLDGGGTVNNAGKDLLTYRAYTGGGVTVNLRTGAATGPVGSDTLTRAVHVQADGSTTLADGYSTFENLEGTDLASSGDSLTGDDGDNIIRGLAGNDAIDGGDGNDTVIGGAGADALTGGSGVDWADYRSSPGGVTVELFNGTGSGSDAQGDTLAEIENLRGSDHTDVLTGHEGTNVIDPGLSNTNAHDTVDGGLGTDTLFLDYSRGLSGKGLIGGIGFAKANPSVPTGSPDSGYFYREVGTSSDELDSVSFVGIERLHVIGTSKADEIYGGQDKDVIETGSGNDVIVSGLGSDFVRAGDGDDTVTYGTDSNRVLLTHQDPPADYPPFFLSGGRGIDTLSISLSGATEAISLVGGTDSIEAGVNLRVANGAAVTGFERLEQVRTGSGDDTVTQLGRINNDFRTGDGLDTITSGLGADSVDGGLDLRGGFFIEDNDYSVQNQAAFFGADGDLLVLDYSSLGDGTSVVGATSSVPTVGPAGPGPVLVGYEADGENFVQFALETNSGRYRTLNPNPALDGLDDVSFNNIERLHVTGTDQNDVLIGTSIAFDSFHNAQFNIATGRGDDILIGGAGDDIIQGYTGDDQIFGGDGNDILFGTRVGEDVQPVDHHEVDMLTGGAGGDLFVLGDTKGPYYGNDSSIGSNANRAIITDFNPAEGDKIQLFQDPSIQYFAQDDGAGNTIITYQQFSVTRVVAEIHNFTGFDLNAHVTYVDASTPPGPSTDGSQTFTPLPTTMGLAAAGEPAGTAPAAQLMAAGAGSVQTFATLDGFTVTAENDPDALLAALGANSGIVAGSASLTVEGAAEAVGTFSGDPFGLGSGIVLSTGRVEDLVGQNTNGNFIAPNVSIPVTFEKIGRVDNTDIFKVDLSNLGIDMRSITLNDSNSKLFGGSGSFSGFDLDFVMLSPTELVNADGLSAADINGLAKLDVFDFSAAGITFQTGTQRNPISGRDLNNSIGTLDGYGLVVSASHLNALDSDSGAVNGANTLGDGGSLGFDLTEQVSTNGPLYLYIGEAGGIGESAQGVVNVSSSFIQPAGDLSTDLSGEGKQDDATTLTYKFTPVAGADTMQFEFVLFSEELPEFAGTFPADTFKIKLNGVDYATLSDGSAATLSNLMATTYGPTHPDLVLNPPGATASGLTRADSYTTVITFTGQVNTGVENVLEVEVTDGRDAFLDSGILIKAGSFRAETGHHMSVTGGGAGGGGGTIPEGGTGSLTVTPPGGEGSCTFHLIPSDNLDLGNGPGVPLDVVFGPGDSAPRQITVTAVPGDGTLAPGRVDIEIECDDPDVDGTVPPLGFEIIEPPNLAPEITSGSEFQVAENTKTVTTVLATDPDPGQTLKYEIVDGADKNLFDINGSTGDLSFRNAPDFEKPADAGGDNVYDVVVRASDNGNPVMSDQQALQIRVTDTADTSTLQVKFVSENAGYKNTLGWYNMQTGAGGILFGAIEAEGRRATVKPGVTTASFVVDTALVGSIGFFLIPNGGGLSQNTESELSRPIKVVQLANGSWAVATVGPDGNVQLDASGKPNILGGQGANAFFTETSKNAGGVDYASSKAGTQQTAATLAGDTADGGPTGPLAWEDTAATRRPDGTFTKPGDADYNDVVVDVKEFKGQTIIGTALGETHDGGVANDVIYGMAGNDRLNGKEGDDKLDGGPGADRMAGGPGNDTYVVDDTGDVVTESSNAGTDTILTTLASLTLPGNVENLVYTGIGTSSGTGNSLANTLVGGPGVDTLSGLGGPDRIEGRGNSDWMSGGSSADTFVFRLIDSNAADIDTITGFVVGQDHLELAGLTIAQLAQTDVNQDSVLDTALTLSSNAHVHLLGVQGVTNWDTLL